VIILLTLINYWFKVRTPPIGVGVNSQGYSMSSIDNVCALAAGQIAPSIYVVSAVGGVFFIMCLAVAICLTVERFRSNLSLVLSLGGVALAVACFTQILVMADTLMAMSSLGC